MPFKKSLTNWKASCSTERWEYKASSKWGNHANVNTFTILIKLCHLHKSANLHATAPHIWSPLVCLGKVWHWCNYNRFLKGLVKGVTCPHKHGDEASHRWATSCGGSHCPSSPQVCFRDCQHSFFQLQFLCRSGCRSGGATALWVCPRQSGLLPSSPFQKAAPSLKQHRENSHIWQSFQRKRPASDTSPPARARGKESYPGCHPWLCCSLGNSGLPRPRRVSSHAAPTCCGGSPEGTALSPHKPHHPVR